MNNRPLLAIQTQLIVFGLAPRQLQLERLDALHAFGILLPKSFTRSIVKNALEFRARSPRHGFLT